jgi:hypothetical protein
VDCLVRLLSCVSVFIAKLQTVCPCGVQLWCCLRRHSGKISYEVLHRDWDDVDEPVKSLDVQEIHINQVVILKHYRFAGNLSYISSKRL